MRRTILFLSSALLVVGLAIPQATPPQAINYQGVLRDAGDQPLDGSHDMVFSFHDTDTGGNLLLTDSHTGAEAVTVAGGLFNVRLGGGTIAAGTHSTLAELFANAGEVWLEIEVGGETLTPRVRVLSAGYALNAARLDGRSASDFLDTSAVNQVKLGNLVVGKASGIPSDLGVQGYGSAWGGYFGDLDGPSFAYLGGGYRGIRAQGNQMGGEFDNASGSGHAYVGFDDRGIEAYGSETGGYFEDADGSGHAYVGRGDYGIEAQGSQAGGHFQDTGGWGQAYVGHEERGITAYGLNTAALFALPYASGSAKIAHHNRGIEASGSEYAGYFDGKLKTTEALEFPDGTTQVTASATDGHSLDADDGLPEDAVYVDADGRVGIGTTTPSLTIEARGPAGGGLFIDGDESGQAYVGYGQRGIEAQGSDSGGYFRDVDGSGECWTAEGNTGIRAGGNYVGGYFEDLDSSGTAWLGHGDVGITAFGSYSGGYFHDTTGTGNAYVATGDVGITASGDDAGGYFNSVGIGTSTPSTELEVAGDVKVQGSLEVGHIEGWLQYARGTFVVDYDPDSGSTSPTFENNILYWDDPFGSTDYTAVCSHHTHYPALPQFLFIPVHSPVIALGPNGVSITSYRDEDDNYIHNVFCIGMPDAPGGFARRPGRPTSAGGPRESPASTGRTMAVEGRLPITGRKRLSEDGRADTGLVDGRDDVVERSWRTSANDLVSVVAVSDSVNTGDLLVIDPDHPEMTKLARLPADHRVLGIVAVEPGVSLQRESRVSGSDRVEAEADVGSRVDARSIEVESLQTIVNEVRIVQAGMALCKVDAGYGEIRPGDLLTSSPTPGHAMRSDDPQPGTIVGKSLGPLETGTGLVKVLVMLR